MAPEACAPAYGDIPACLAEIVTPLCWQAWEKELENYPDQRFRQYIMGGMQYGFCVGVKSEHLLRSAAGNMPSVCHHPDLIRDYLASECALIGPLPTEQFRQVHTSRFGLIPKSPLESGAL